MTAAQQKAADIWRKWAINSDNAPTTAENLGIRANVASRLEIFGVLEWVSRSYGISIKYRMAQWPT